jgi:hypothetical protein
MAICIVPRNIGALIFPIPVGSYGTRNIVVIGIMVIGSDRQIVLYCLLSKFSSLLSRGLA